MSSYVVLSGTVAVVEGNDDQEHIVQLHGPHSFLGELGVLEGQTAFLSAVVSIPGEVLAVGPAALRDLLSREPALGDVILRAYLLRRTMLAGAGTGFRIIGSAFLPRHPAAAGVRGPQPPPAPLGRSGEGHRG